MGLAFTSQLGHSQVTTMTRTPLVLCIVFCAAVVAVGSDPFLTNEDDVITELKAPPVPSKYKVPPHAAGEDWVHNAIRDSEMSFQKKHHRQVQRLEKRVKEVRRETYKVYKANVQNMKAALGDSALNADYSDQSDSYEDIDRQIRKDKRMQKKKWRAQAIAILAKHSPKTFKVRTETSDEAVKAFIEDVLPTPPQGSTPPKKAKLTKKHKFSKNPSFAEMRTEYMKRTADADSH